MTSIHEFREFLDEMNACSKLQSVPTILIGIDWDKVNTIITDGTIWNGEVFINGFISKEDLQAIVSGKRPKTFVIFPTARDYVQSPLVLREASRYFLFQ